MTAFDEAVLNLTMSRVQAWEQLNDREYAGQMSMSDFYDLLLRAGYNEQTARKAANKRGWQRLQAGVKM